MLFGCYRGYEVCSTRRKKNPRLHSMEALLSVSVWTFTETKLAAEASEPVIHSRELLHLELA